MAEATHRGDLVSVEDEWRDRIDDRAERRVLYPDRGLGVAVFLSRASKETSKRKREGEQSIVSMCVYKRLEATTKSAR